MKLVEMQLQLGRHSLTVDHSPYNQTLTSSSTTTASTTGSSNNPLKNLAMPLFLLARDSDWECLQKKIDCTSAAVVGIVLNSSEGSSEETDEIDDDGLDLPPTLLHAVLSSSADVPLDIVRAVVKKGGRGLVSVANRTGDYPLHVCCTTKCQNEVILPPTLLRRPHRS